MILIPRENVAWDELEHSEQIDSVDKRHVAAPPSRPSLPPSVLVGAILVDTAACSFVGVVVDSIKQFPICLLHFPAGPSVGQAGNKHVTMHLFRHASLSLSFSELS